MPPCAAHPICWYWITASTCCLVSPISSRNWTGSHNGVRFHGQAKLGAKESNADIEKYAVNLIGVPAGAWVKVDEVQNTRGWERAQVFKANVGSRLLFGMYGVGPKGNYLLYLDTTPDDYMAYKKDYDKWYESIRLD